MSPAGEALLEPRAGRSLLRRCGGRQCAPGTCDHEGRLHRYAAGPGPVAAPPLVDRVLGTPGEALDRGVRSQLEPGFGHDFGAVRVHTDAQAAASADAVQARAYTVGNHITFAAGAYRPATEEGRRLIAHELAHTVQQGPTIARTTTAELRVGEPDDPAEHHADAAADRVMARAALSSSFLPAAAGPMLRRQGGGRGGAAVRDPVADARAAAFSRVFTVYQRLAGLGPAAPAGLESAARMTEAASRLELRNLARRMFDWDNPNMDQITEIVGQMRDRLGPQLQTVRAPQNDPECGNRAAYVVGGRAPVHLCPAFYSSSPEQRIRTMIHEAAHLVRIGQPSGESYCTDFDCSGGCGGFEAADSWAHFVHCASGQRPDQPTVIRGGRPRGGTP